MTSSVPQNERLFHTHWVESPLGPIFVIGDDKALYVLEFGKRKNFEQAIERFQEKTKARFESGLTTPLKSIESELAAYFKGQLRHFETPTQTLGTPFQQMAWQKLTEIPYGETRSYAQQALSVGSPLGHRAVAGANSRNRMSIILPCHRIINANGSLGGYAGGLDRKQWLLDHEKAHAVK